MNNFCVQNEKTVILIMFSLFTVVSIWCLPVSMTTNVMIQIGCSIPEELSGSSTIKHTTHV